MLTLFGKKFFDFLIIWPVVWFLEYTSWIEIKLDFFFQTDRMLRLMRNKTGFLIITFVYLPKILHHLEMCLFYIMSYGLWNVVSFSDSRVIGNENFHKLEFSLKETILSVNEVCILNYSICVTAVSQLFHNFPLKIKKKTNQRDFF